MAKFNKTGYKNPPKHTRFKKGKSGNPAGRPKRLDDTTKVLKKTVNEKITVKDRQGKIRNMSKIEAMLQNLMTNGMKGDLRAVKIILELLYKMGFFNEVEDNRRGGGGVLVVPSGELTEEEWEKKYYKGPRPDDIEEY